MQHIEQKKHKGQWVSIGGIWKGLVSFAWMAGLVLAGSDGKYMPWLNGMGVVIFASTSLILAGRLSVMNPEHVKTVPEGQGIPDNGIGKKVVGMPVRYCKIGIKHIYTDIQGDMPADEFS